jgi:hypothetical protein
VPFKGIFLVVAALFSLCGFGLLVSCAAEGLDPWLLNPGKYAGPITARTSIEDLKNFYGSSNIINIPEGDERHECEELLSCTVIFPKDPSKRIEVYWQDSDRRENPSSVRVVAPSGWTTDWHLPSGISTGTTLEIIEKLNGRPFDISGYFCDAGGVISDWQYGQLSNIFPLELARIQLSPTLDISQKEHEDYLHNNLLGCSNNFSSASEAVRHIQPRVGFIAVNLK